ncbi:adenosylcobinamide-phosphate synthase CbiB [Marinobacter mobilis]|uniref:Cobalamin biosynthesis protein CobD n=1 Tax=Marinobacter mobilis TaxID=488533 RepID=A0A1H2Y6T7_9GAMM|nr:adenosylcobinamide-phosphate synthase CbiB [Marinobacter mobilis]SDX00771.1 adenosylcobinamide-phosphate synthase [Marinobacter mobilis]SDX48653.1 adenosylcobinamide-phosphate synthase [Marinobacter mobilis]
MAATVACGLAVAFDRWFGEPRRWHPLVGFGTLAGVVERRLNQPTGSGIARGGLALLLVTALPMTVALMLQWLLPEPWLTLAGALVLWLAMSLRGLAEHGEAVAEPLAVGALERAREQVGRIVSRQASALDDAGVAAAASESMLENGADAVFASLFWFLLAGIPGVVLHRLVNTLDAMWGYRNDRFLSFGRTAARLDDLMNWVPARLTALTYALLGNTTTAWRCWRSQAPGWDSPNAGPVMAAGAGALGVTLGGPAPYAGTVKVRPILGQGPKPDATTVRRAIDLVTQGVWLWLLVLVLTSLLALLAEWAVTGGVA